MKKLLWTISLLVALTICGSIYAMPGTESTLTIEPPKNFVSQICPAKIWNDVPVVWGGITDSREGKEVGVQNQGKNEPIEITATPPLAQAFDGPAKEVFAACGIKFIPSPKDIDEAAHVISVDIEEFHAGVTKKLATGSTIAKSTIKVHLKEGFSIQSAMLGMEMESKGIRSGKLKQMKKALDELFFETLKLLPTASNLKLLK